MAEKRSEDGRDGLDNATGGQSEGKQAAKRCSSAHPSEAPAPKSPRSDAPLPTAFASDAADRRPVADKEGFPLDDTDGAPAPPASDPTRRKSLRRATLSRRSLLSLPNQHQTLCRNVSMSLSREERLDQLFEASMRFAIERTRNSLKSVPKVCMESFQKQVEQMQKKWACQAHNIKAGHLASEACSDNPVNTAMEKVRKATDRFQVECERWEALLNKHRTKAEELEKKVEQSLKKGVSLDSASVAQSSQYRLIQSKPDYHSLCRHQPLLQAVEIFMDTQRKMVLQFQCFREQTQLLVKEYSSRLAAEAGFQNISPDVIKKLLAVSNKSSATS